jgi:hypothetical protein
MRNGDLSYFGTFRLRGFFDAGGSLSCLAAGGFVWRSSSQGQPFCDSASSSSLGHDLRRELTALLGLRSLILLLPPPVSGHALWLVDVQHEDYE